MMVILVCSNEGLCPFPRVDNYEIGKTLTKLKNLLSRTSGPISTRLGMMHPLPLSCCCLYTFQINFELFDILSKNTDVEMTWTKTILFWLNTVLLCYNFYMSWMTDPGFIKSDREQKLQVCTNV